VDRLADNDDDDDTVTADEEKKRFGFPMQCQIVFMSNLKN